jgi:hypothetical protein
MPRVFQTQVSPEAHNESLLNDYVAKFFNTSVQEVIILKRSIDAVKSN